MNEKLSANYLGFMQQQILSYKSLLVQHQKIYKVLKKLLALDANVYILPTKDRGLIGVMTRNNSVLNALKRF